MAPGDVQELSQAGIESQTSPIILRLRSRLYGETQPGHASPPFLPLSLCMRLRGHGLNIEATRSLDSKNIATTSIGQVAYDYALPWYQGGFTGKGFTLAILDSGVSPYHPMLNGRGKVAGDLYDIFGHGTAMAGIAAGSPVTHEWAGLMHGIAYDANIHSIRILDRDGNGSIAGLAGGINRATKLGVPVISISAGIDGSRCNDRFCRVAKAARRAAHKGLLIFAANGNEGPEPGTLACPAKHPSVIAVGAEAETGAESDFSAIGHDGYNGDVRAAGGANTPINATILQQWLLVPTSHKSVIWREVVGGQDPLFEDTGGDTWMPMMGSSPSTAIAAGLGLLRYQSGETPEDIFTSWTGRDLYQ